MNATATPAQPTGAVAARSFLVGAAVPALVASAAWWLGVPYIAVVAAVGSPIGGILALAASERLARDWASTSALLGLGAPLIPGSLIGLALLLRGVASSTEGGPASLAGGVLLAIVALVAALAL